jgi:hypothetical protein
MPNFAGFEEYVLTGMCLAAVPALLVGAAVGYWLRGRRGQSKD